MPGKSQRTDSIRVFVCIEVPAPIQQRIGGLQAQLRATGVQISWTKASNIHLTIKFLGDVATSRIPAITEGINKAASVIGSFKIEVAGTGCFPSERNPRVLWVGIREVPDALKQLHSSIENELASRGFAREPKKFSPHLTIGRVRNPQGASGLAQELIATGFEAEEFNVSAVTLMQSKLNPAGSIYTPISHVHLSIADF